MFLKPLLFHLFAYQTTDAFILPRCSTRATVRIEQKHQPWISSTSLASISFSNRTIRDANTISDRRFDRTASKETFVDQPCILHIQGKSYNMTEWAKSHPGGSKVLERFHDKDATKAFFAAGHSQHAIDMLEDFVIQEEDPNDSISRETLQSAYETLGVNVEQKGILSRIRTKLFTKEDPIGIHKYCGIFVLLHFAFRYYQSYFGDYTCGFGGRMGRGPSILPLACLVPHTVLSLSSLIFHTVPKERIVGRPMIWQEFRAHNIIFGLRSILCTLLGWMTIYKPEFRKIGVVGSSLVCLSAVYAADVATEKLRQDENESTTATMPYWDGCSVETQRKFKTFYAYCQFMATMGCLITLNPGWPLLILLPIQLASLLMTLVRKGLLSAKGYHIGYTISLCMPYFSLLRQFKLTNCLDIPIMSVITTVLFAMRRKGFNKYLLWATVAMMRIFMGDSFLSWQAWIK